ncbi:MBL fold metallo-hydrolase [Motiliproteus sp. MSK22-1]|uniref:MBL fold metallo-hydrolase n=1 Tax=Motiliproteus sp. MSK22-1 TaxID=1897630 RepID=UPI000975DAE5|nr:MBL fold metallo-hydrolase [Motiliproteus sp. MSK22-1]OMH35342.1 hypothetical protein BGP75_10740 [Motiliproteus sp. MSK22-1]
MPDSLQYPFSDAPDPGSLIEVAPGIHWLRMPLPFALNHINLWLLEDADGWTLVDTGIGTEEVKGIWETLIAGPLSGQPIKRIIVTHFHPDHLGLAGWLSRRFDAPVLMTQLEYEQAVRLHDTSGNSRTEQQQRFFSSHGLGQTEVEEQSSSINVYRSRVPELPRGYQQLKDQDQIRIGSNCWQVIVGRGHSPEHMCLYCPELDVLIAGDQMLPTISPNISVTFMNPDSDPLSDYLASLKDLAKLPSSVKVLPAHGLVFYGLHQRVAALAEHHQDRLNLLLDACEKPKCAADVLSVLFNRTFGPHELFFAMGEAVAHLHHLVEDGLIQRQQDSQGVIRFLRMPI